MRYIKVSIVPLFLLLLVATALPASASDDFDDWAIKRSGEIDGRWDRAAIREAGTTSVSSTRSMDTVSRRSTTMRAARRTTRSTRPSRPSTSNSTGIDGSSFTKRGGQDFLWQSTRKRNGASRGASKLTSPSQTTRASSAKRRLPGNSTAKYRRSVGAGRAHAWRKSARMGTRTTSSGTRRRSAASSTRGATRSRRSAR